MKDIDFDELDKAVSSLMGNVKDTSDQPAPKTLKINTTLKEGELPTYENISQAAEKIGSEAIAAPSEKTEILLDMPSDSDEPATPAAAPLEPTPAAAPPVVTPTAPAKTEAPAPSISSSPASSGRFMDVMHPSSDMKTATQVTPVVPPAPVTTSPAVESTPELTKPPVVESMHPVPMEATPEHAASAPAPVIVEEPVAPSIAPIAPVDQEPEAVVMPPVSEPTPEELVAQEQPTEQIEPIAPQTSPFLPDAKVEKRPLGGAAAESSTSDLASSDTAKFDNPYSVDNSADTQLSPTQAYEAELPAEFHTELLAIETNVAESSEQTAATSDAQNGTDVSPTDGAIFDTTEYHKTVAHPAKHKPEWIWIVLIIGIIVICAAGAAAFYLLGTQ